MSSHAGNTQILSGTAQLYTLFNQRRKENYYLNSILHKLVDINYQVPSSDCLKLHKPDIIGCTALHFAVEMEKIKAFNNLLCAGADFTIKNANGSTALHRAVEIGCDERSGWKLHGKLDNSFICPILLHHICKSIAVNPSNKNGISHFHAACMTNHVGAVEFFLDNGVPIDHAVNADSPVFSGYTGLHFAARCCGLEVFKILVTRGADIRVQDAKKMTPMHVLIERNMEFVELINTGKDEAYENIAIYFENNRQMMKLLMSADTNKVDSVGLSHFHVACTMKDTSMVERFLEENVDVNQAVNADSPVWPGYTPLHFAVIFNFDIVKLLLEREANIEAKHAKGATAFDMCMERYSFDKIHYVLSNHQSWKNIVLSDCKTKLLDIVLSMQSSNEFDELLRNIVVNVVIQQQRHVDICVPKDSPLWPCNTLLHLSVLFYEMTKTLSRSNQNVKPLQLVSGCLRLGLDVTIKNLQGYTPLQLAFRSGREDVVEEMLQHHHPLVNPVDEDGLSHLHIACAANNKLSTVNLLASCEANVNLGLKSSFKWYATLKHMFGLSRKCIVHLNAGSTPLHIAVIIGSVEITELLLKHGADVYAKDADGLTPIHRVLTSCDRINIGKILLSSLDTVRDCITDTGLSHLHVAGFVNNVDVINKLLEDGTDVNVAIASESSQLRKDASIEMCDNPFTFVNSMSIIPNSDVPGYVSVTVDKDSRSGETPVDPYGESSKYLNRYAGFTALHFAMRGNSQDAVQLLVNKGANILIKGHGLTPLYDTLNCNYNYLDIFTRVLKENKVLQESVLKDTGITMLHIACHKADVDMVLEILNEGIIDVNAPTHLDSPVWPKGCTPLHVLLMRDCINILHVPAGIIEVLDILLLAGADVTRQTADTLDTPVHIAERVLRGCDNESADSSARICILEMLRSHKDFSVNPTNISGYSFFHIACRMNEVDLVREYLSHGVDVNQTIDFFANERAGETPLIVTAGSTAKYVTGVEPQLKIIDLLLKHGANVHAKDSFCNTPLHTATWCGSPRESLLELLISHGADMYAMNILGETPFEKLLATLKTTPAEIEVFLKHGFSVNAYNSVTQKGYLTWLFSERHDSALQMPIFETMINSPTIAMVDGFGRTAIHNIVSSSDPTISDDDFVDIIHKLSTFGLDVDRRDKYGKTALHTATKFLNHKAVSALLKCGADIDLLDKYKKPALAYFTNPELEVDDAEHLTILTIKVLIFHLQKLRLCGLGTSRYNWIFLNHALVNYAFQMNFISEFMDEIEIAKITYIGRNSLTLHDFLSETAVVAAYPRMNQVDRDAIKEFFESTHKFTLHRKFKQLGGLLALQYRKAVMRVRLQEKSKTALLTLVHHTLPDLCTEAILRFLPNSELLKISMIVLQASRPKKRMRSP